MLHFEGQAATAVNLLTPASAANTAAATGSWVDVREYEGDLVIVQHVGAVTGSLDGKIQHATDGSGTGAADVAGATFTQATAAGIQKITIPAGAVAGWVRYVGTIVTGPAVVGVSLLSRKETV